MKRPSPLPLLLIAAAAGAAGSLVAFAQAWPRPTPPRMAASQPATAAATAVAVARPSQPATLPATRPASNSITRADVEKIPLDSRIESAHDPADVYSPLVFADLRTAVHFTKPLYTPGEPINTFLIVHSTVQGLTRTVKAAVDFGAPGSLATVDGSARLQLVALQPDGGERIVSDIKPPGGGAARLAQKNVVIKPNDFWVPAGDVRHLVATPLAPGKYVLRFWLEGQRAEGQFEVAAATSAATAPAAETPATRPDNPAQALVFSLGGGWQGGAAVGTADVWKLESPYPSLRNWSDFETALPLGIGDGPMERYYPRIADIPAADDYVGIAAQVVGKGMKEIKITLTPQAKGKQIPRFPSIYLVLQSEKGAIRSRGYNERDYVQTGNYIVFTKPITIDITMQNGNGPEQYIQGKARLSVIVASDPVWYGPVENGQEDDAMALAPARVRPGSPAVRWTGMVRSASIDVVLGGADEDAQ